MDSARLITNSPVLARMPWYTLPLEDVSQVLTVFPFEGFVQQLLQYGTSLSSFQNSSMATLEMQRILNIDLRCKQRAIDSTPLSSGTPNLTVRDWARLCTVISAYRLLDVATLIHGHAARGPKIGRCYLESQEKSLRGMDQLADWPDVLITFQKMLKKSSSLRNKSATPANGSPPVRLWRMISRNSLTRNYTAVEANFLYAAMHLACMNGLTFPKDVCPDLPDSFDNMNIFKKSPSRQKMVNVSNALGNQKPQLLLDVEHAIWKTLFLLALGNLDPLHLLLCLEKDLPWDRIQSVKKQRDWFKLDSLGPLINQMAHPPVTDITSRQSALQPSPLYPLDPMLMDAPCSTSNELPFADRSAYGGDGANMKHSGASHMPGIHDSGDEMNGCEFNDKRVGGSGKERGRPGISAPGRGGIKKNADDTEDENSHSGMEHNNSSDEMRSGEGGDEDGNGIIVENGDGGDGVSDKGDSKMDTSDDPSKGLSPNNRNQIIRPAQRSFSSQGPSASKGLRKRRRNNGEISTISNGGTQGNPIDVDLYCSPWEPVTVREFVRVEEISFKKDKSPPKIQCDIELQAFDAAGVAHKFTPEFHFEDYNIRVKKFFERIEEGYNTKGEPPHIADPNRSGFAIIPFERFRCMPTQQLQQLLRRKNIVVTEFSHPNYQFDKRGMRTLGSLDSQVLIQDYSVPRSHCNLPTTVTGVARDILDNANSPDGKILNGIDFPMWKDAHGDHTKYATDMVAWGSVRGRSHCGHNTTPYPTEHMRWGLAGTANTVDFIRIDSDGFSTFIEVMCGKKVWAIYRESPDLPLSSTDVFFNHFLLDDIDKDALYYFEAVVLRQGDLLLMRPGTPHFVYGPENTICHGGHFYSTSPMQTTLQSLIHSFVLGNFITKTSHHPSRQLLRRIIVFFGLGLIEGRLEPDDDEYMHLPDVETVDGLLDLLAACILAILGNVLDLRTYSAPNQHVYEHTADQNTLMSNCDWNDIPGNERMAICYTRGVALAIFHWIRSNSVIKSPDGNVIEDLPSKSIVQVLNTLLAYKAKAKRMHLKGAPHCDIAKLRMQVANLVRCDAGIEKVWAQKEDICDDCLKLTLDERCSIEWKSNTVTHQDASQYQNAGMTPLDRKFFQGWSKLSLVSPNPVKRQRVSAPRPHTSRGRAGSSSKTSPRVSGHGPSPALIYSSDRSRSSNDSPPPHCNRQWVTNEAGTPGSGHLSSEKVVMRLMKSYEAYFFNPDDPHDKSFEPHPECYPVVELEYPNQGALEIFILLAPKDRDHYNPIIDLEQTLYTMVECYLTEDQKALFGPVPSASLSDAVSPSLCFIPSDSTLGLTPIDRLPVLLAVQRAIHMQHGPLLVKVMKHVNKLLHSIKCLQISEDSSLPHTHNAMMAKIESWTGNPLPDRVLMRIIDENYQRTVGPNIRSLRLYQPFSSTVYGELMPPFIHEIVQTTRLNQDSLFLDLGSGVANVVTQASLQSGCTSYGIELLPHPARVAKDVVEQIKIRCRMWGVKIGEMELEEGNMLESRRVDELIPKADVVLVNNKVFEESLNAALRSKFLDLKEGACVISLQPFVHTRVTRRMVDDISAVFDVEEKTYQPGHVSWAGSGGHYYLHRVDRQLSSNHLADLLHHT